VRRGVSGVEAVMACVLVDRGYAHSIAGP